MSKPTTANNSHRIATPFVSPAAQMNWNPREANAGLRPPQGQPD
jgi:hypothetical protein